MAAEEPYEPRRGITRRDLLAGTLGVAATVAGHEFAKKLIPEQEKAIKLPVIVGVLYRRNPSDLGREVGYFPDAGDSSVSGEEIILDKMDKDVPDGKRQVGKVITDENGVYIFQGLEPGEYQIDVSPRYQKGKMFAVQGPSQKITVAPNTTIVVGPLIGRLN